jgi:hypothetical protein
VIGVVVMALVTVYDAMDPDRGGRHVTGAVNLPPLSRRSQL